MLPERLSVRRRSTPLQMNDNHRIMTNVGGQSFQDGVWLGRVLDQMKSWEVVFQGGNGLYQA